MLPAVVAGPGCESCSCVNELRFCIPTSLKQKASLTAWLWEGSEKVGTTLWCGGSFWM